MQSTLENKTSRSKALSINETAIKPNHSIRNIQNKITIVQIDMTLVLLLL